MVGLCQSRYSITTRPPQPPQWASPAISAAPAWPLGLEVTKDMEGKKLMMKMARPRKGRATDLVERARHARPNCQNIAKIDVMTERARSHPAHASIRRRDGRLAPRREDKFPRHRG